MSSSKLLPIKWTAENYINLFTRTSESPILRWLLNTALVSITGTILVVTVDLLAAFALARLNLPGKNIIIAVLIWVLSLPEITIIFPQFYIMRSLHLVNTFFPLIFPYSAKVLGVYMLYSFLRSFPRDLEEAALIDGASLMMTLRRIIFPSIRPSVITLAFLTFLAIYNDYLWPNLIITQDSMRTLTIGVASLVLGSNFVNPGMMMTAVFISTIPVLLIFLLLNRYITQGITHSGLK